MESSVSAMAQRAREALGLEGGSHQQQQHYLKYRQQHVHEYPSEYSLGEYSVGEQKFRDSRAEVQRIRARTTECQKVHKLTARTGAQVCLSSFFSFKKRILAQWVASMIGVVAVGLTAFATLAIVKKDEKFEREVFLVYRS